jgi:indole-3-glycerol phosphate synthase
MTSRIRTGILGEIAAHKQTEVAELYRFRELWEQKAVENKPRHRSFEAALTGRRPAVIAEIKKASPSKGLLQPNFDPAFIATTYENGGAAALSVLTDGKYFQGSLADLELARGRTMLPVLRKDFTIDPIQIYEAAAHGADAILLIAALLDERQLRSYRELAEELGLSALVEVHDGEELKPAVASGAKIIGVNNRNLETFEVSLDVSLRLSDAIPAGVIRVSESGIFTRQHIDLLLGAGYQAFLVGESLMKSNDAGAVLRDLLAERRR